MLARLTVSTSVVWTQRDSTRPRSPGSRAMVRASYDSLGEATRNSCFSARCWKLRSCAQLHRGGIRPHPGGSGGGGDVAHRGGELVVLVVERARRRRQPEHAGEPPVPVERRRRDAAEVEVELLALDRVAVGADA